MFQRFDTFGMDNGTVKTRMQPFGAQGRTASGRMRAIMLPNRHVCFSLAQTRTSHDH